MSQDVAFPLQAVGEAAAAELAGETLLGAAVGAAGGGRKDFWEPEFRSVCQLTCLILHFSAPTGI